MVIVYRSKVCQHFNILFNCNYKLCTSYLTKLIDLLILYEKQIYFNITIYLLIHLIKISNKLIKYTLTRKLEKFEDLLTV